MKYLLPVFVLLISGCSPFSVEPPELPRFESTRKISPEKPKKAIFKPVDVDDVETAKNYLEVNKERRKETVMEGISRAKDFEDLRLKLIYLHDFGYDLKSSDVEPFRDKLVDISAIFTNEESKQFTKYSAQDSSSIAKLYKEAQKGEENNQAFLDEKEAHEQLKKKYESGAIEESKKWSNYFFALSAFLLAIYTALKIFANGLGGKTLLHSMAISISIAFMLLLSPSAMNYFDKFLNKWGDALLLLLLVPSIISVVVSICSKIYKKIKLRRERNSDEPVG